VRVEYVTDPSALNSNYRAYQPMSAVQRKGYVVDYNRAGAAVFDLSRLLSADVVHIHRYLGGEAQKVVERLHAAGVGLVWDNDDDLTNVPRSNPKYRDLGGAKRGAVVRALTAMLRLVDVVTTPSARLAEQFHDAGARDVRVIENYVPDAFPGQRGASHDGVVIAWIAALEHQLDYQQLRLRESLGRLLERYDDLRVLSIGLGLGLPNDRYEHVRRVGFLEIPAALAAADIGIAPLTDVPWNAARSNVKVKEYACAGLPWLASRVGPYLGLGEHEGGRLVDADAWDEELARLVENARDRRKLAKRAARWVKGETIGKHVMEWETAYRDAHARARERRAA
jgi:glycosyltransferase involved in cell wall biosynthesis